MGNIYTSTSIKILTFDDMGEGPGRHLNLNIIYKLLIFAG